MTPSRIRLSRTKGWRKPAGAVVVARPSKWGNPWKVDDLGIPDAAEATRRFEAAVAGFISADGSFCAPCAHPDSFIGRIICNVTELRGRDLCCWCALDQPCHADILLRMANR